MSKPTDTEIMAELGSYELAAGHIARNLNYKNFTQIKTAYFLRGLKRLERAGKVERVETSNKSTIFWRAPSKAAS